MAVSAGYATGKKSEKSIGIWQFFHTWRNLLFKGFFLVLCGVIFGLMGVSYAQGFCTASITATPGTQLGCTGSIVLDVIPYFTGGTRVCWAPVGFCAQEPDPWSITVTGANTYIAAIQGGNSADCDGWTGAVTITQVCNCGDGNLDAGEQCDDKNTSPGDGCDENCLLESLSCSIVANPDQVASGAVTTGTLTSNSWVTSATVNRGTGNSSISLTNGIGTGTHTYTSAGNYILTGIVTHPLSGNVTLSCTDSISVYQDGSCGSAFGSGYYLPDEPGAGDLCDHGTASGFIYTGVLHKWIRDCVGENGGATVECDATELYCGDEITNGPEECDDGNQTNGDGCSDSCLFDSCVGGPCDLCAYLSQLPVYMISYDEYQIELLWNNGPDIDASSTSYPYATTQGNTLADARLPSGAVLSGYTFTSFDGSGNVIDWQYFTTGAAQFYVLDPGSTGGRLYTYGGNNATYFSFVVMYGGNTYEYVFSGSYIMTPVYQDEYWASCNTLALCGNGTIEGSELCDDGNTSNGDGCDEFCLLEDAVDGECDFSTLLQTFYSPADQPSNYTLCSGGVSTGYAYHAGTGWSWDCEGLSGGTTMSCSAQESRCGDSIRGTGIGYVDQEECDGVANCASCSCDAGYMGNESGQCVKYDCYIYDFSLSQSGGNWNYTYQFELYTGDFETQIFTLPVGAMLSGNVNNQSASTSVSVNPLFGANTGEYLSGANDGDLFAVTVELLNSNGEVVTMCSDTASALGSDNCGSLTTSGTYVLFNTAAYFNSAGTWCTNSTITDFTGIVIDTTADPWTVSWTCNNGDVNCQLEIVPLMCTIP